jgi:excisionase family DNA binding protein
VQASAITCREQIEPPAGAATTITPASVALMYLRAEQVLQLLPVSRRTISNWQRTRRIKFYRVGRTVLFKRDDIEKCLERFAVNAIGEPKRRHRIVEERTDVTEPRGKRRMKRVGDPPPEQQKEASVATKNFNARFATTHGQT